MTKPTPAPALIDDGRCNAITAKGERCKRRDLAWMHFTLSAKRGDPDGHLCCPHWLAKRAKRDAARDRRKAGSLCGL